MSYEHDCEKGEVAFLVGIELASSSIKYVNSRVAATKPPILALLEVFCKMLGAPSYEPVKDTASSSGPFIDSELSSLHKVVEILRPRPKIVDLTWLLGASNNRFHMRAE